MVATTVEDKEAAMEVAAKVVMVVDKEDMVVANPVVVVSFLSLSSFSKYVFMLQSYADHQTKEDTLEAEATLVVEATRAVVEAVVAAGRAGCFDDLSVFLR